MNVRELAVTEIERAFSKKGLGKFLDNIRREEGVEFDFVKGKIEELMNHVSKVVEDIGKGPSVVDRVKSVVKGEKESA